MNTIQASDMAMFSKLFNKNKNRANDNRTSEEKSEASQANPEPASANQAFSQLTAEKLKAVIQSLNQAEPLFLEAGYQMQQLSVSFGNTPTLTPQFKLIEMVDQETIDALLQKLDSQQLIKFVIISLSKSSRMQSLFDNSPLYFHGMEIDISGEPSVRTIFKRRDSVAEVIPIKPNDE